MKNFIAGMFIGLGVVIPGVSGAVIAILFGIYDKIIYIFSDFFHDVKKNIRYLLPIILGIIISIYIFGNLLIFFIEKYEDIFKILFAGLIVGSIPVLLDNINKKETGPFKVKSFIIAFGISLLLNYLKKFNFDFITNSSISNSLLLLLIGILYVSGKIIPGISSAFFLIIFNLYDYILSILINPFNHCVEEYIRLIPFFMGVFLGFIILMKIINIFLSKYFSFTYSCIIGFVFGSVFSIIPENFGVSNIAFYLLLFFFSFFLTYFSYIKLKKLTNFNVL